jgi:hypothetical protein
LKIQSQFICGYHAEFIHAVCGVLAKEGAMVRPFIIIAASGATLFSSLAFEQEPDFSGMWAHPYWPSFELPLSGPGPIVNKMRRRQQLDADGRPLPAATAPLAGDPLRLVGDYANPILKPDAAKKVKQQGELELSGGAPTSFTTSITRFARCG